MSELNECAVTELCKRIARKELSSRELLDACIARIEQHNAALNAVVASDLDAAREAAARADDATARGLSFGALHGIPMTIKDAFSCKGLVSTGGVPELKDHVPSEDASAVARLREAGAIIIGKTNVPLFSGDWQSFNDIYGATNNPWSLERTPGGSSGGAAAAVASGMTTAEIGSDIGGSIRLPAHFCGVYGLKTSFGVVPMRGHIPPAPRAISSADLSVAGPIARSAMDLELLLSILAGDAGDAEYSHPPLAKPRTRDVQQLRIAVWRDEPTARADKDAWKAVSIAADALEQAGAKLTRGVGPEVSFDDNLADYCTLLFAIISTDFPRSLRERLGEQANNLSREDHSYGACMARGAVLSYAQAMSMEARRARLKEAWRAFFTDYDAVLCPAVPVAAIPHQHDPKMENRSLDVDGETAPYQDLLHWASLAAFAHLPAAAAPVMQTDGGLPVGVQIIGPYLGDRTVVEVAKMLEQHHRGFVPPPLVA